MIVTRVVALSDGEELVLEADELVSKGHALVKGEGRVVGSEEARRHVRGELGVQNAPKPGGKAAAAVEPRPILERDDVVAVE